MKLTGEEKLSIGFILVCIGVALLIACGWVLNIIDLINAPELAEWGGKELLRVVGIFIVPVGGILGYF